AVHKLALDAVALTAVTRAAVHDTAPSTNLLVISRSLCSVIAANASVRVSNVPSFLPVGPKARHLSRSSKIPPSRSRPEYTAKLRHGENVSRDARETAGFEPPSGPFLRRTRFPEAPAPPALGFRFMVDTVHAPPCRNSSKKRVMSGARNSVFLPILRGSSLPARTSA